MTHVKKNRIVVCKSCENEYEPFGRPYRCPHCNEKGFWLSPHEFSIQLLIRKAREGDSSAYETLGSEILLMTKKLIWPYIWAPMDHYVDEIVGEVVLHFFKVYKRTTENNNEEIRCVYALLNFLCSRLSTSYSKKVMDTIYRSSSLTTIGENHKGLYEKV